MDTTTQCQSGPGCNGNKEVLHILQSSRTGALSSDGLVSYQGHSMAAGLICGRRYNTLMVL